jgi:hypothetical protein
LEIVYRLASIARTKEINPSDIKSWCQQVETEIICDVTGFYKILQHERSVSQVGDVWQIALPENMYKLDDVYSDKNSRHSRLEHKNTGTHLIFLKKPSKVFIDYLGMPFQETEPYDPLILKGHEQVCEAFCKVQLFEEDYLMNKIDGQRFGYLQQNLRNAIGATKSIGNRHVTIQDKDRVQIIRHNLFPTAGNRNLSKHNYGTA